MCSWAGACSGSSPHYRRHPAKHRGGHPPFCSRRAGAGCVCPTPCSPRSFRLWWMLLAELTMEYVANKRTQADEDAHLARALRSAERLGHTAGTVIISADVFAETITILGKKLSHAAAVRTGKTLLVGHTAIE